MTTLPRDPIVQNMNAPRTALTALFDLDGTLIDSIELIWSCYRHTALVHTSRAPADEFWLAGLGRPLEWQFAQLTDDPAEVQRMIVTYRAYNHAHHDAMVKRYPGAVEAVRALKRRGARVGVVTSKLRSTAQRGLAFCGFDGLFDVVIGADDVQHPKPDGEPVRRALDALVALPDSAIMVGDSPHDIAAGRAAGVRTAAALWGPFPRSWLETEPPDYWLAQPSDIALLS